MSPPELPSSSVPARSYYPALDGLRAIAIAMVMLFHMRQEGIPIPGPMMLGQTGVDLFFVLSGFLITSILLKGKARDWREVRTFYIRRALRIFPLYYGYLLGAMLLGFTAPAVYWIYLQNFTLAQHPHFAGPTHFWSLAVEEHFYLVWPFMVLFLPRRFLPHLLAALIAGALLFRFVLAGSHLEIFYLTPARIDGLAAGSLLAVLQYRGSLSHLRRAFVPLCIVSGLLLAYQGAHTGVLWIQITKFTAISAFYAGVLGFVLTSPVSLVARVLGTAPLRFVGRISYGLYVFHPAVFTWVSHRFAGRSALLIVAAETFGTFALALVSWYAYERHFIDLKERWAPERARFPKTAPTVA